MTVIADPEQFETRVIHELVDFTDMAVLEIGGGDGRMTIRFADRAKSVLSIDPDSVSIDVARRQLPEPLHETVTFEHADILDCALPRKKFDIAVLAWSL